MSLTVTKLGAELIHVDAQYQQVTSLGYGELSVQKSGVEMVLDHASIARVCIADLPDGSAIWPKERSMKVYDGDTPLNSEVFLYTASGIKVTSQLAASGEVRFRNLPDSIPAYFAAAYSVPNNKVLSSPLLLAGDSGSGSGFPTPELHYIFADANNLGRDYSSNGRDAEYVSGISLVVDPEYGLVTHFPSGADFVITYSLPASHLENQEFTVAAFMKNEADDNIVTLLRYGYPNYALAIRQQDSKIRLIAKASDGSTTVDESFTPPKPLDTWSHVAVTFNYWTNTAKIYYNGAVLGLIHIDQPIGYDYAEGKAIIGHYSGFYMADFQYYSEELSYEQIHNLYLSTAGLKPCNPASGDGYALPEFTVNPSTVIAYCFNSDEGQVASIKLPISGKVNFDDLPNEGPFFLVFKEEVETVAADLMAAS